MLVPYYIFGILYLVILAVFFLTAFFNLYHLIKFGFFDFTGKLNTIIFTCAWAIILTFSFLFLKEVPWLESFDIIDETIGQIDMPF